jgi:hypothetical protein
MALHPTTIEALVKLGANVEITSKNQLHSTTMENIIKAALTSGARITIDAGSYQPSTLEQFVKLGQNRITIRL